MKYKVLAFDIDGTLTNSRKEITPETRAAILRAADMGCTIVIATGRRRESSDTLMNWSFRIKKDMFLRLTEVSLRTAVQVRR